LTNNESTTSLEAPAPNGFHLYIPQTGQTPHAIYSNEKTVICFVVFSGTFYLDDIKLLKNQVYFKTLEAADRIRIRKKGSSVVAAELLIFRADPDILKGKAIPLPDSPANLSLPALKIISRLSGEDNHSAAAAWMNRQIIEAFIYSVCFQNENKKTELSYWKIKKFQYRLEGINTRQHTVPELAQLSARLYHRPPKKLEREKIMESAIENLIHSSKTLDLLARESGYRSRELFITAFKNHFGIPPGRLRTNLRILHRSSFS